MCPKCLFADISTAIVHTHFFLNCGDFFFLKAQNNCLCFYSAAAKFSSGWIFGFFGSSYPNGQRLLTMIILLVMRAVALKIRQLWAHWHTDW